PLVETVHVSIRRHRAMVWRFCAGSHGGDPIRTVRDGVCRQARGRATRQHGRMKILFVCLGNICRSPTAEGVVRAIAAREYPGIAVDVDSAGTADYHVG